MDGEGRILGRLHAVDLALLLAFLGLVPVFGFALRVALPLVPQITRVSPREFLPGQRIRIEGENFLRGSRAFIGESPIPTSFQNRALIVAHVAGSMEPGEYAVRVVNPRGLQTEAPETVRVLPIPGVRLVPVTAIFLLEDLPAPVAERLASPGRDPESSPEPDAARIVDLLSETPVSPDGGVEEPERRHLLVEAYLISEVIRTKRGDRFFYRGQPLRWDFPVALNLSGVNVRGRVYKEPVPISEERREFLE